MSGSGGYANGGGNHSSDQRSRLPGLFDQAIFLGIADGLKAVAHLQFLKQVMDVIFNGEE